MLRIAWRIWRRSTGALEPVRARKASVSTTVVLLAVLGALAGPADAQDAVAVDESAGPNAPGSMVIEWSLPMDLATVRAGILVEQLQPDFGWVPLPPDDVVVGTEDGASETSTIVVMLRCGWPRGMSYRIRLLPKLADELGRAFGKTELIQWHVPAATAEDPAPAVAYEEHFPTELDSARAAADTVGGRFPGGQNRLFHGMIHDPVTGLAYARNRWYDPRTGTWLSEDPAGDVDSPNLYAYVGHQPTMATDPLGREAGWMIGRHHQQLEEVGIDPYRYGRGNLDLEVVTRNMMSIGISFTIVGMGYDGYSAVSGYDPVLDEEIRGFDRWLTGLGMVPGISGAKVRQGRRAAAAAGETLFEALERRRQLNTWNEYQSTARGLDLTPAQRAKLYHRFQDDLVQLGIDPSLVRIVSGDPEKVAVIGRGMEARVRPVAEHFGAETFSPSTQADIQFRQLAKSAGGRVPDHLTRRTLMYEENQAWIRKIKEEGYTVIDLGEVPGSSSSVFFDMELEDVYGSFP